MPFALLKASLGLAAAGALAACELPSRAVTDPSAPVVQIVTAPDLVIVDPYETKQFLAYGRTQAGDSVPVGVRWSAAGGTITSNGLYTTDTVAGDFLVTATASNAPVSGSSRVSNRGPLAQVIVTPATAATLVGGQWQFVAYGRRRNGDSVAVSVAWSATGGAISAGGLYTAGPTGGTYRVIATDGAGRLADTATVTVTVVPVASVTLSPASANLSVGQTVQLTATPKDASGNPLLGRLVTWASSNTAVATVNGSGLGTGVAAGSATVTAMSEGQSATAALTVAAASGGVTLFQEGFDDANLATRGWYDGYTATISSTEYHAGGGSIEARLPAGAQTSSWSAKRHLFTPTATVYVSFWVKYTPTWVGSGRLYHPHEFVILSDLDGDWDGPSNNYLTAYIEQVYQNGGVPQLALQDGKNINLSFGTPPNNLVGVTEDRSVSGCNGHTETSGVDVWNCFNMPPWYNAKEFKGSAVAFQPTPGPGYKANWNHVEAYFQMNSVVGGIGQTDGIVRYWFNGVLVIERMNVLLRTGAHPTLKFKQIVLSPYIGDGSPIDQTVWYDDLTVATVRP